MKKFPIVFFLLLCIWSVAQNPKSVDTVDFNEEIKTIQAGIELLQQDYWKVQREIRSLKKSLSKMKQNLGKTNLQLDSLQKKTEADKEVIIEANENLGVKIQETSSLNDRKISVVHNSLSNLTIYGIVGVILALIVSGLIYWILIQRQKSDKIHIIEQLSKTKSSIEDSLIKELKKQTAHIESQLKVIEEQKKAVQSLPNSEHDHSLAMKVADEITLIERNVKLMDPKTKGIKQLNASIGKLKDNLAANGYDMPELIGKQFQQGMKVRVVSSIPDENLEEGSEIITKIIKPQINYKDKMIQTAQIEVSVAI